LKKKGEWNNFLYMNFLACDLGGTKVLLGIFEKVINDDSPKLLFKKKYVSSDWDSFELILEDFLKNECKNITHPSSACFAVAGPLSNNSAKIMNLSWNISGNKLKNKFKFEQCELINDFAVQIYGIPFLKKNLNTLSSSESLVLKRFLLEALSSNEVISFSGFLKSNLEFLQKIVLVSGN